MLVNKHICVELDPLHLNLVKPDTVAKQKTYVQLPFMNYLPNSSLDINFEKNLGRFYPQIYLR